MNGFAVFIWPLVSTWRVKLLGIWIAQTEGAKLWLSVLTELQNRGVEQILIACVDGLSGFPDAINTAFPDAKIQLCIIHMVRNSMKYVAWKDYKAVTAGLKRIYQSPTEKVAAQSWITLHKPGMKNTRRLADPGRITGPT